MISCSNLYQDLTTTTVEFTKESIASIKSRVSGDDENYVIFATVTCGKRTQTKTVDIADIQDANGVTLQFDKLPVGKTGTLYVSVGSKKVKSELETYYSENIAVLDEKTQFRVQPNGNTKIKVSLTVNEERFFADFLTFLDNEDSPISNIELNFTEYSTITAPLPVGTTRWQIYHNDNGYITYLGSFGEKIDVAKDFMQYKEYFINLQTGKNDTANFEATGNPMNQIKTPIVYSSFDSTPGLNAPYLYNFANSLDKVGGNTEPLLNLELVDYCFDNAGNLYFIMDGSAYKLAYDFDTNSYEKPNFYENEDPTDSFYSEISAKKITYDVAQNTLYLLGQKEPTNGNDFYLVKFQNPAGTIYKQSGYQTPIPFDDGEAFTDNFFIHDGVIYTVNLIPNNNTNSSQLFMNPISINISDGKITLEGNDYSTYDLPINLPTTTNFEQNTDIMYQDGSLYVIFRCYNTYWSSGDDENYSTGGILKYDISSKTFDSDFGIKGFATEFSFESMYDRNEITINYFAPTLENETQVFYGPTKFVAIMPKKLVFLDQGADVEGNDEAGRLSTKSRIVEYDLSTNTFSSKEFSGKNLNFMYSYS